MTGHVLRAVAAIIAATAIVLPATPAQADIVRTNQWHLRALNVAAAHKISQGEGVTVAVIDCGVDPHADLRKNLLKGTDVVPGGTGNGWGDAEGHGTEMAGLIAAHGRGKATGALGIAPKAKILPIRVETRKRVGNGNDLAKGIRYAISKNADVINVSSGGNTTADLGKAVDEALAKGIIIVAAAGNRPIDILITSPAYLKGVVAVGASDQKGRRAPISVTGDELTILAPGVSIHSTTNGNVYSSATGTSDSTAIVSGAVALIRSKYPKLSAEEVVHRLTATATDKGKPGRDPEYGYGVLNLVAALTANVPPLAPSTPPSGGATTEPAPTAIDTKPSPAPAESDATFLLIGLLLLLVAVAIAVLAWLTVRRRRRHPATHLPPGPPPGMAPPRMRTGAPPQAPPPHRPGGGPPPMPGGSAPPGSGGQYRPHQPT